MGSAGSGKSMQATQLVENNDYEWVSTGELFRAAMDDPIIKARLLAGHLISDEEAIHMLDKKLKTLKDDKEIVLDGFPRTVSQAEWLIDKYSEGKLKLDKVFVLILPREIVVKRLMSRGRADDTEEGITKRFEEFDTKAVPVIEYLKTKGIKVFEINGDQDPMLVHQDILKFL